MTAEGIFGPNEHHVCVAAVRLVAWSLGWGPLLLHGGHLGHIQTWNCRAMGCRGPGHRPEGWSEGLGQGQDPGGTHFPRESTPGPPLGLLPLPPVSPPPAPSSASPGSSLLSPLLRTPSSITGPSRPGCFPSPGHCPLCLPLRQELPTWTPSEALAWALSTQAAAQGFLLRRRDGRDLAGVPTLEAVPAGWAQLNCHLHVQFG